MKIKKQKIVKKLYSLKESIGENINKAIANIEQKSGEKTKEEYAKKFSEKNYVTVKGLSVSVGSMIDLAKGKIPSGYDSNDRYLIYSKSGRLKYKIKDLLSEFCMYDAKNQKIGTIKESLITGIHLIQKEIHKCNVRLYDDKLCSLKKYEAYGEVNFETLEGSVKVVLNTDKTISIKYKNKVIGRIYQLPLCLKNGFVEKFIIEYKHLEKEEMAILLAIAVDIIDR